MLHGLMSDETHSHYSLYLDGSLENYKNSISHLGKLTFCFCVLILFAASIDEYEFSDINIYLCILLYCVYSIYLIFSKNIKWAHKMWMFIVPTLVLFALFFKPISIDGYNSLCTEECMGKILFITLVAIPVLCIIRYYWEDYKFDTITTYTDKIEESFQAYSKWKVSPTYENKNKITDHKIRAVLDSDRGISEKQNEIDEYIYSKVTDSFQLLKSTKFVAHQCIKLRQRILNPQFIFCVIIFIMLSAFLLIEISCFISALR